MAMAADAKIDFESLMAQILERPTLRILLLAMIPGHERERIEILTGGASAIRGAASPSSGA